MLLLALDISSSSGWALFEDGQLRRYGRITNERTTFQYGEYPYGYVLASSDMGSKLTELAIIHKPDIIVIEETNLGKFSRYSQKYLEFIHCSFLNIIKNRMSENWTPKIVYLNSSEWRKLLGIHLTKEDKALNSKLSKAKSLAKKNGTKLDKVKLGIKGKINKKHVALRYINLKWNLDLKIKDNDIADAIALGESYFHNPVICTGK